MMRFPMSLRMFGTAGVNAGVTGVIIRRIIILAVVLIVTVIGALSLSGIGAPRVSSLWTIPAIKSTPGGNRQRESERYQATVRTANDQNITRAMTEGASHLPIPESIPEGRVTEQATGTLPWMQVEEGEARWDPDPLVDRTIDALSPDDDPNGDDGGDDGFESVTGADGQPGAVPGDVGVIDSAGVGHDLPVWESGTPPRIEIVPPEREQAPPVHEQERLDAYAESMLAQMSVIAAGMTIGPMGGQILMAGERR
ncbi:MAG: hypothetical protein OXC91_05435, partial [Rhodobacteraceae bacterium]|nr:hypothetical protein [Paracoccaceae bacterium]